MIFQTILNVKLQGRAAKDTINDKKEIYFFVVLNGHPKDEKPFFSSQATTH